MSGGGATGRIELGGRPEDPQPFKIPRLPRIADNRTSVERSAFTESSEGDDERDAVGRPAGWSKWKGSDPESSRAWPGRVLLDLPTTGDTARGVRGGGPPWVWVGIGGGGGTGGTARGELI